MTYYLEPGGHIRDTVKLVLDLSNCVIKKELEHATFVHTSDLTVQKILLL